MNGGRQQTRIFAEAVCRHIRLPKRGPFTLCDFGCALGDGLRVFRKEHPQAVLWGTDFSNVAISRCQAENPGLAAFVVGDFDNLRGRFDVIFASAILEHFADYEEKTRILLRHCQRLLAVVPYKEMNAGKPIEPSPRNIHQRSFTEGSFDFLLAEGRALSIEKIVVSCPPAWGWTWRERLKQGVKNLIRPLIDKPRVDEPFLIIFDIARKVAT